MEKFTSIEIAFQHLEEVIDDNDGNYDNFRMCYLVDGETTDTYEGVKASGCCGSHDEKIIYRGREAMIGCNFGH